MYKIFIFRKGRVKAIYDNVLIQLQPKQKTGEKEEKKYPFQLKKKGEKGSGVYKYYDAIKQILVEFTNIMMQLSK